MASDKRSFLEPAVLGRLLALPLHARQAMLGSVSGKHRSPVRGSSLEFAQYRKYVPGDDTRRLDWRTWGRSDRFYIKEFEADTNLRLCLLFDTSGSMALRPRGRHAARLRAAPRGHARLSRRETGRRAWACGALRTTTWRFPPSAARRTWASCWTSWRASSRPAARRSSTRCMTPPEKIRQRALVVVLSDLFVPPAELKSAIQHLRFRRHDVAVFHLLDQQELDFDFDRPARFVDMEGGEAILADPSLIARNYREAVRHYLAEMDEVVRTTGIDYHRVKLHESYDDVLVRFLLGTHAETRGAMTFLQPAAARCPAAGGAAGHHPSDPPVPPAAGEVGGDDVPPGRAAHEQGPLAAAAGPHPRASGAGGGRDPLRGGAAAGGRLARADGRRAGHGAHPARPLREHGSSRTRSPASANGRRACATSPRRSRMRSARARGSCSSTARSANPWPDAAPTRWPTSRRPRRPTPAADMPALMQGALDYITTNKTGRTDVWLLSDLQESDWDASSGRWETLRDAFATLQGVRFHLLCYPQAGAGRPRRHGRARGAARDGRQSRAPRSTCASPATRTTPKPLDVPLRFVVNGAATTARVTLKENQLVLQGYAHPHRQGAQTRLGPGRAAGRRLPGEQRLPFRFRRAAHAPLRDRFGRRHRLGAARPPRSPPPPTRAANTQPPCCPSRRAAEIPWADTAFIVWQAPIPKPDDALARQLRDHVAAGRTILFLPPDAPGVDSQNGADIFGLRWDGWEDGGGKAAARRMVAQRRRSPRQHPRRLGAAGRHAGDRAPLRHRGGRHPARAGRRARAAPHALLADARREAPIFWARCRARILPASPGTAW